MTDWLQKNGVSIAIALATLVSTYAVYGYRLQALEDRVDRQGTAITDIRNSTQDTQIALARIQTDIEYIKVQLNKLIP